MKPFRNPLALLSLTVITAGFLAAGCGGTALPSSNADLAELTLSAGELSPTFDADSTSYTATVGYLARSVRITPTVADSGATVTVNGVATISGTPSGLIGLDGGGNTVTVTVTAADKTTEKSYIITATRQTSVTFAQQAYIKASNTASSNYFGYSVALSGNTLAVGAHYENSNATGIGGDESNTSASTSGAVYIFTKNETIWTQEAYIKASNTGSNDRFGTSVALSGDTLAVGAENEDSNATGIGGDQSNDDAGQSGAVYVFTRSGTTWSQQAYVKASNTGSGDRFGRAIALSGDTLATTAYYEDSNATGIGGDPSDNRAGQSGAAYVFTRSGTTWSQQAYIKASNTEEGDQFGTSVALSGDRLAVGAWCEDSSATGIGGTQLDNSALQSGAVYVFARSGNTWTQEAYIKASNTDAGDVFGHSVSLSGNTLAIGASNEDSFTTGIGGDQSNNWSSGSGAVYLFTRAGITWSQQAYIKASNTGSGDYFGRSVALSGDSLAVDARYEDSNAIGIGGNESNNNASGAGAVYLFTRTGTTWAQKAYIKASNTREGDRFGRGLALSTDTLAVGAHVEDGGATGINGNQWDFTAPDSGAVYVFE